MSSRNSNIPDELYDYIIDTSLRDQPLLKRLRDKTAAMKNGGMQISPDQGQFMALLIKLIGAKKTLEVGVFTGYSSLIVAQALPDDGQIIACDISEEFTSIAKPFWKEAGVAHKIDLRIGPAKDSLDALLSSGHANSFDFAFIDADKEGYPDYYERSLKLLRPGGLILIDNAFMGNRVTHATEGGPKIVKDLNAALKTDQRVDVSLLSIGDGLYLARKR
ncbi:MAG: class I SAM-dependent methyltransferase [bacterium]|nr:class I SAM-dependent methyltransferase [bacterium]